MKVRYSLLAAGLLSMAVQAADTGTSDNIIVTATRSEIPYRDAIVPVTVISREDIELSSAGDLAELLRFEAGIDIGRNGGAGQATSVFMRGTESNHTLILVDGVRMNPGTIGGGAVQHISPEVIERVEIVKGARSALYGTEAIGGVINIITRRADERRLELGVGGGSFNTQSAYASAAMRRDNLEFGLTVDRSATDGFAPSTASDIERGYDNLSVNLHAAGRYANGELAARHWHASGNVEYLDFFLSPVDQDFRNSTSALEWTHSAGDNTASKLILSHVEDDIRQNQSPDFVISTRKSLDWQLSHAVDNHNLAMGVFLSTENAESLSFGSGFDADTDVRALFVQDQWSSGPHRAFVAARFTDHETFGNATTWNAEYAYNFDNGLSLSAGAGRAFRAPDATDRFGFGGNIDLRPEISRDARVSAAYQPTDRHRFSLELYDNRIDDLIEFEFVNFTLVNVDEARVQGAELAYEYNGESASFAATVIRQSADNETTDGRLLRRAEESATLRYQHKLGDHRLGLSLLASGDRVDFGGTPLAGYVLTNLTGEIRVSERFSIHARIENLLDTDYETASGFRMQERSAFVELRSQWN